MRVETSTEINQWENGRHVGEDGVELSSNLYVLEWDARGDRCKKNFVRKYTQSISQDAAVRVGQVWPYSGNTGANELPIYT